MSDNHARLSPALVETIAGLAAGTASTLAVHPLDVIKTRLQIHRKSSSASINSFTVLRSLIQGGHPIQSLYRGLTPNLLGNAGSWGIFFYFKSIIETQIRQFHNPSYSTFPTNNNEFSGRVLNTAQNVQPPASVETPLTPLDYFLASGVSGLLITVSTNPIWVLKTRMLSSDRSAHGAYQSMWAGAKDIWTNEGWRGFYKGLAISCVGVSHGAVQFGVYEPLKRRWLDYTRKKEIQNGIVSGVQIDHEGYGTEKLGNYATLMLSGTAKVVAGIVTYPYQVVRSRLQTYDSEARYGKGIRGVTSGVWKEDGIRGFYKGLGPNVLRVMPATWVTFLVYENVRYYLPRLNM